MMGIVETGGGFHPFGASLEILDRNAIGVVGRRWVGAVGCADQCERLRLHQTLMDKQLCDHAATAAPGQMTILRTFGLD